MALDWEFLFAWLALLAVVVAPVRLAVIAAPLPEVLAWTVLLAALAGTFLIADWLDRVGFEGLDVAPGGPATFVVAQFLFVPTVALAIAPPGAAGPDSVFAALDGPGAGAPTEAWAAVVPAVRPAVVHPVWALVHLLTLPLSVWLGLYGGLARAGLDPRRTSAFVLSLVAILALGLVLAPVVGVVPDPADRAVWIGLLACEVLAGAVAYGPTPAALARAE